MGNKRRSNEVRACATCGAQFSPWTDKPEQQYCSGPCRNAGNSRSSAAQRGDALRHAGEGRSYLKLGGRHAHRVIAEQVIGRPLRKGEIVHHVDHDKRNNDPANLQVITQSEHINLHRAQMYAARALRRDGKEVMPNA